ncbi:MAG: peptide chain release factor N(5)-glutamine methyltransferase [Akkermansiaceae bacterium]|nr:peptide chain release factor N(5)-glutamine methyltransferase [Akkermansiaceae bacterium]
MKTVHEVLCSGTAYLEARQIEGARASMQSLLAHVLGTNRTWLYLHAEDPLSEEVLAPLRELLRRRGQGTPLQHLLGNVEFFRRSFRSDSRALIPRPETEELVEQAQRLLPQKEGLRVLDMGCGSGVIGISLALELQRLRPEVVLADVSSAALDLALENATTLGARVKTYCSDLFSAWRPAEQEDDTRIIPPSPYDAMLANLPYVPAGEKVAPEVQHDPATALYGGPDGLDIIRRFIAEAPAHLAPGALVMLEVGHDQGEAVRCLMQEHGFERTALLRDMSGVARFPLGYAPATGAAGAAS